MFYRVLDTEEVLHFMNKMYVNLMGSRANCFIFTVFVGGVVAIN